MRYRIVAKSNFDREDFSEYWVSGPSLNHEDAKTIAQLFNDNCDANDPVYYKAEPLNYKLYKFEP